MHCKKLLCIVVVGFGFYSIYAQSLMLEKIINIETSEIYTKIKQVSPLPDNLTAIWLNTSNSNLFYEFENLSIVKDDSVIQIFQHYYYPYEVKFIKLSNDKKYLLALKLNIEDSRDVWLHRYNLKTKEKDSLNVPVKRSYKDIVLTENELSFFRGPQYSNDSMLLEQVFDIDTRKKREIWQVDAVKKSFNRGNRTKETSYYTLSSEAIGAYTPERTPSYLLIKTSSNFKQIEFYSSNEAHNYFTPYAYIDYNPIFPINDSILYVIYEARKQVSWNFTHRNFILASFNTIRDTVNWQYHGLENYIFSYVKPTPNGIHVFYDGESRQSYYQFINTTGELEFEDNNSGEVRYCTANDECFIYSNDTIFLKKFDEILAYYVFENLEEYNLNTFHPNDEHHYVTLEQKGTNIINIYQLRLDTMVNIIESTNSIESFEIYPNPATTIVNLSLPTYQHYTIEIHPLNGKAVAKYNFTGKALQLTNLNLATGTYFIKVKGRLNEKQYFSKLFWLGN